MNKNLERKSKSTKKLDKRDFKILHALDEDASVSVSVLAKKAGLSKQNLNYRMKKYSREDILRDSIAIVDIHKLGYLTYRVYFRFKGVDKEKEERIIEYFKEHENVLWFVGLSGAFDLEVVFVARNSIHINNILKKVKEDIGKNFSRYNFSSSIFNYQFNRDYLIGKPREHFSYRYYGFEPSGDRIDELDVKILKELSENCRQSSQELGEKLKVSYHTIKNRINILEQKKIIQGYRSFINLEKINRKFYKALIKLNNPSKKQEEEIYGFCSRKNFVVYLVEVLGEWQLEIETEVSEQEEFNSFMRELRNEFSNLIEDYEVLQVTKEHKVNFFPIGNDFIEKTVSKK